MWWRAKIVRDELAHRGSRRSPVTCAYEHLESRWLFSNAIGLNFIGTGASVSGTAGAPAGFPQANWNNLASAVGSFGELLDDAGADSGASAQWQSSNPWALGGSPADANAQLFQGYLDTTADSVTSITVKDIPFATYNVFVYFDGDSDSGRSGRFTLHSNRGSQTVGPFLDTANWPVNSGGGTFVQAVNPGDAGNYAVLPGSGSSFTLQSQAVNLRGPINAIQIVATNPGLIVNSTADTNDLDLNNGVTTLREAVHFANLMFGHQTIRFDLPADSQITLGNHLFITDPVSIVGPGASNLTLNGNNANRAIHFSTANVASFSIEGLTFANGHTNTSGTGGAILIEGAGATLRVAGCEFASNTAGNGGAIGVSDSRLIVSSSTFANNQAVQGGAIHLLNAGESFVQNSTFSGNTATDGSAIMVRSTGAGKTSTLTLLHSTVQSPAAVSVDVQGDAGSTGAMLSTGSTIFDRTVAATANFNIGALGSVVSLGHNLADDASGNLIAVGDQQTVEPLLRALGNYGGETRTQGLDLTSLAIHAGAIKGIDVASSGNATQSSNESPTSTADLALDGNPATYSQTAATDVNAWWEMDLGSNQEIGMVVLSNSASEKSRLRDITIEVFNEAGERVHTSSLLNPENTGFTYPDGPASLSATPNVVGRWVRVRRAADPDLSGSAGQGGQAEANTLQLAEVQVLTAPLTDQRGQARSTGVVDIGAFEVNDFTPPAVQSSGYVFNELYDAFDGFFSPHQVRVQLSEGVLPTPLGADLQLQNLTESLTVDPSKIDIQITPSQLLRFKFTQAHANGILPDGNYRAILPLTGAADASGNPVQGTVDFQFFVLNCDANGDRVVNTTDFNVLAGNFGTELKLFSEGNFDYDSGGHVDSVDFVRFAGQYGKTLPAIPPPTTLPASGLFSSQSIDEIQDLDW